MSENILRRIQPYLYGTQEALAETLWPTRCAVCDTPYDVLCNNCLTRLAYLEYYQACPQCGAPFGRTQCTECNPIMLSIAGRDSLSYDKCLSVVTFDEAAARIVRTWKDQGERRLTKYIATLMTRTIPPLWLLENPIVTPIPASKAARRRRGYDHGYELAQEISMLNNLSLLTLLCPPHTKDQRILSKRQRLDNMENRFELITNTTPPSTVILVDDVYTTGSTLLSASDTLKEAGVKKIYCLTFARVW